MVLVKEKSVALLTVIIIIFILMILSSVMLSLLSSQTRLIEHDISRVKSKYADEAAMVRQLELLRKNQGLEGTHSVSGRYDQASSFWTVDIDNISTTPDLTEINLSTDYSSPF
ncbi:MAG: hypothetical protein ISS47_07185 [Candidatus Omnitrophica bacterium]|nr:hypothetical protein [Candidatus Omnitrophota bacterium]